MSFGDILKILSVFITFFAIVLLYVFEMDYFSNTIDVNRLVIWSLIISGLIGAALGWLFSTYTNILLYKFQLIVSLGVVCAALGPLLGSLSNRMLAGDEVEEKRVRVMEYKAFSTSIMGVPKNYKFLEEGHALIVEIRGTRDRFVYRYDAWQGIEQGDLIALPFKQGFWGFDLLITELKLEDAVEPSDLPDSLYQSDTTRQSN